MFEKFDLSKKIYVVAEIGINHNGDLQLAKELIDIASSCKCDAVKFQKREIDLVYSKEILEITDKPVSCEVFADDIKNMISQGLKINNLGKNIYVKVPVTNSKGKFMGDVIKTLNNNKINPWDL